MRITHIISIGALMLLCACQHGPAGTTPESEPVVPPPNGNGNGGNGGGGGGNSGVNTCDPDTIYFNQDILPFLVSNCAKSGCHDAATHQDGIILNSYENVMATADVEPFDLDAGKLYEVITESDPDDIMPPPPNQPLSQQQINMIATWINQGAQNLTCSNSTCDSVNVSFSTDVWPLIQNKCYGCHSGAAPGGGINLTNHAGVSSVAATGQLMGAINHEPGFSPMPKNGTPLSACEKGVIQNWISEGKLNN